MADAQPFAAFYTIIGFGPDPAAPFADTDTSWNAVRGVRTYKTPSAARGALSQPAIKLRKGEGITYKILETVVYADGNHTTGWLD